MGFLQDGSQNTLNENSGGAKSNIGKPRDVLSIMGAVVPNLQLLLMDNDRIAAAANNLSTNIIGPAFRSKSFPDNVSAPILDLLQKLSKIAHSSKGWKKDVLDAFNEARFFSFPASSVTSYWLPILQQWTLNDKDRMPEILSRITAPTAAGIMFGVGATSARLEADRKTQLNLRRIATLILSSPEDSFVPALPSLQEKIVELLTATASSSPSSITRSEVFMLFRAIVLKTSSVPLAPLWPIINSELTTALNAILPDDERHDRYSNSSIIQVCKFLDALVALDPDEFQLHEWLYVTDTIDAVYRPPSWQPTALADALGDALMEVGTDVTSAGTTQTFSFNALNTTSSDDPFPKRQPLFVTILDTVATELGIGIDQIASLPRMKLVTRVVRPFFSQLSLWAFESRYGTVPAGKADWKSCMENLVEDLFGGGIVGD
jgi:hypothetical protein